MGGQFRDDDVMLAFAPVLISLLNYLCFALLLGFIALIAFAPMNQPTMNRGNAKRRNRRHYSVASKAHDSSERRLFIMLSLSLLLWQVTLFWETRAVQPALQLWLGRMNFGTVALAVFLAWRFVWRVARSVPGNEFANAAEIVQPRFRWLHRFFSFETALLTVITLFTPLVDAAESVVDEHPITRFGPLFPVYLLHVLGYLKATLTVTFRARRRIKDQAMRGRLAVIGIGILATGGVSLVTNALLPYGFGDFRFCDIGTLSTLLFLLSVAYAVFVHGLFDIRIVVRITLVYGILMTFVMGIYSAGVLLVTQYLTGGGNNSTTQFLVLFLAFSFDPLRRYLEDKTDILLFGKTRRKRKR